MVEHNPIEQTFSKENGGKMVPEGRKGNIALDIQRPLYELGPNWEF